MPYVKSLLHGESYARLLHRASAQFASPTTLFMVRTIPRTTLLVVPVREMVVPQTDQSHQTAYHVHHGISERTDNESQHERTDSASEIAEQIERRDARRCLRPARQLPDDGKARTHARAKARSGEQSDAEEQDGRWNERAGSTNHRTCSSARDRRIEDRVLATAVLKTTDRRPHENQRNRVHEENACGPSFKPDCHRIRIDKRVDSH